MLLKLLRLLTIWGIHLLDTYLKKLYANVSTSSTLKTIILKGSKMVSKVTHSPFGLLLG